MANPAITGSMTLRQYGTVVDLSTATAENVLGNTASSGKVIEINQMTIGNDDGSASATVTVELYDQDGTPMNSDVGADQAAIGADVVAGSSKGAIVNTMTVNNGQAQVVIDKTNPFYLLEDRSIVVTASAANDLTVTLSWTVKG